MSSMVLSVLAPRDAAKCQYCITDIDRSIVNDDRCDGRHDRGIQMLNAQHESEPSTRPPVRALSPPPVLITEREVALGARP